MENLEQEQYLEDLGRKLSRSHEEDLTENTSREEDSVLSEQSSLAENFAEKSTSVSSFQQEPETTQTMATTSNRIETEQSSTSRLPDQSTNEVEKSKTPKSISPVPVEGLEETADKLGVEPEFLVEKGTKAILRMIARNGGQLRFPLEIDQID